MNDEDKSEDNPKPSMSNDTWEDLIPRALAETCEIDIDFRTDPNNPSQTMTVVVEKYSRAFICVDPDTDPESLKIRVDAWNKMHRGI